MAGSEAVVISAVWNRMKVGQMTGSMWAGGDGDNAHSVLTGPQDRNAELG